MKKLTNDVYFFPALLLLVVVPAIFVTAYHLSQPSSNDSVEEWTEDGFEELSRGRFYAARECFTSALILNPNDAKTWYNVGSANLAMQMYDKAIMSFNGAIKLNPKYREAYLSRAAAYMMIGHNAASTEDFNRADRLQPTNSISP